MDSHEPLRSEKVTPCDRGRLPAASADAATDRIWSAQAGRLRVCVDPTEDGASPRTQEAHMATSGEPHSLQLRIDPAPDGLLRLVGELDLASRPQLCSALQSQLDAGAQHCVLDVTELSFCDSAGLAALVWAENVFPDGLLLQHPNRQLRKILRATHLEQVLTIA